MILFAEAMFLVALIVVSILFIVEFASSKDALRDRLFMVGILLVVSLAELKYDLSQVTTVLVLMTAAITEVIHITYQYFMYE